MPCRARTLVALAAPRLAPLAVTRAQAPFDSAALAAVLRDEMRAMRAPGVAIAVVRGGRVVWQRGFGVTSVETGDSDAPSVLAAGDCGAADRRLGKGVERRSRRISADHGG